MLAAEDPSLLSPPFLSFCFLSFVLREAMSQVLYKAGLYLSHILYWELHGVYVYMLCVCGICVHMCVGCEMYIHIVYLHVCVCLSMTVSFAPLEHVCYIKPSLLCQGNTENAQIKQREQFLQG